MKCINLDIKKHRAFIGVKKKGVPGNALVDIGSKKGKASLRKMEGKPVAVIFFGRDRTLFTIKANPSLTYSKLIKKAM